MLLVQDEMGEDGEHRFARRAQYPPDGHPTQTDMPIVRMVSQAPATATGRLMFELANHGQNECEDTFEERFPSPSS